MPLIGAAGGFDSCFDPTAPATESTVSLNMRDTEAMSRHCARTGSPTYYVQGGVLCDGVFGHGGVLTHCA